MTALTLAIPDSALSSLRRSPTEFSREMKLAAAIHWYGRMSDEDINYSDIPPTSAEQWRGAEVGKFYHFPKEQLTLQVDADVVAWFKAQGRDYQTRINDLLRQFMLREAKH